MLVFLKTIFKKIVFFGFSVMFLILALCVEVGRDTSFFNAIYLPLKWYRDYIRSLGKFCGRVVLYIILGLLPLAFRSYKMIYKKKNFYWFKYCVVYALYF